jgi:hypothetical protein
MNSTSSQSRGIAESAWTAGGLILLLLVLARYPVDLRPVLWPALAWWIPFVAGYAYLRWRRSPDDRPGLPAAGPALALWLGLLLLLVSHTATRSGFFFMHWADAGASPAGVRGWVGRFFVASLPAALALIFVRRRRAWLPGLLLLIGVAACAGTFLRETSGVALYRDDHASFMYRLWVFGKTFPQLPYYDPNWNGGREASYLVASGVVAPALPFWPLWRWLPVHQVYTPVLTMLFIVGVPALAVGSVRLAGGTWRAAWCGGVLALGLSRGYFVWLLHFGTIGYCFSAVACMPLCAGLYRVLWLDRREWWLAVVLVTSAYLFLCWPIHVLGAGAVLLSALASARVWTWPKWRFLLGCAAAVALLHLPSATVSLFLADVRGLTSLPARKLPLLTRLWDAWSGVRETLIGAHPLLVIFGLGGLAALRPVGLRVVYGSVALAMLLFAVAGETWKPELQGLRVLYTLLFAMVLPAAGWLGDLLDRAGPRWAPVGGSVLALLALGLWNTQKIYGNKGHVREMSGWIRAHTPPDARILFAGATVHAYGGGHVAYLVPLTGREMMACDYFHFSNRLVEYEYPPRAFRRTTADMRRFMDLYNVSHVITHYDRWARYFRAHPDTYQEVHRFEARSPKYVFRVLRDVEPFHRGRGSVSSDINRLDVRVEDPGEPVVLRYHWADALQADAPVELYPVDVAEGIQFIGAHPRGTASFTIRYRRWL